MADQLVPASIEDRAWLERLRRYVYQDLFKATFGKWDEARHARQFEACWERGGIWIINVNDMRVGMIQLFEQPDAVEVCEIQIQPSHQSQGIGSRILKNTIARAHKQPTEESVALCRFEERAGIAALSPAWLSESWAE